ncbi:MAG: hypothetical protein M1818_001999 [Claussenomyces sp. TS43310]|nr:MAG: hypothetical protein M1818_001999 [Claussenomyces sp. TS43310]
MVKPLSFKGDKKSKKRKRQVDTADKFGEADTGDTLAISKPDIGAAADEDDSWVTAEGAGDLVGPIVYLSCDKYGVMSANNEAVSPLETFLAIPTADTPGTFQIQTLRETFLTIKPATSSKANALPEMRGDATDISFNTTLRIRMQARFKPRLKANKEEKAREKISTKELEGAVGRKLEDWEVKKLKRARREGDYHEALLEIKVKTKHDKYS